MITGSKYIEAVPLRATALNKFRLLRKTIASPIAMNSAIKVRPFCTRALNHRVSTITGFAELHNVLSSVDTAGTINAALNNSMGVAPGIRVTVVFQSPPEVVADPATIRRLPKARMRKMLNQQAC